MIGWIATWGTITSWEAWIIRRRAQGIREGFWLTTMSRCTRMLGRVHPVVRVSLCLFTGGLLYHLLLEEEVRAWVPRPRES